MPTLCHDSQNAFTCLSEACNYSSIQSISIYKCIEVVGDCYFESLKQIYSTRPYTNITDATTKIDELINYGRAGAICSIVASCLFIIISAYLKKYRRWIEQIILSKVVCDLIYAAVLLHQFFLDAMKTSQYDDSKKDTFATSFGVEVVSLMGLIWIPVLFLEVRNVIIFPFSAWGLPKLVIRWFIALVVSFGWACIMNNNEWYDQATYFQYVPVIYIGQRQKLKQETLNMYSPQSQNVVLTLQVFQRAVHPFLHSGFDCICSYYRRNADCLPAIGPYCWQQRRNQGQSQSAESFQFLFGVFPILLCHVNGLLPCWLACALVSEVSATCMRCLDRLGLRQIRSPRSSF